MHFYLNIYLSAQPFDADQEKDLHEPCHKAPHLPELILRHRKFHKHDLDACDVNVGSA